MSQHELCNSLCPVTTQRLEAHVPADQYSLALMVCTHKNIHCWLVWVSAVFGLQAFQLCQ